MDYKTMMGYPKKKKNVKEKVQPQKDSVIEDIRKELNEWNDTTYQTLPKRWSKKSFDGNSGLTEFEKQQVNEVGVAPQHKKFITKINKAEENLHKHVILYKNFLISQGQKDAGMEFSSKYVTIVGGFTHYLKTTWVKMLRKMI